MQTPQVSNPANALASKQPGKQPQAENGTEAFGQALSREVAGRSNGDSDARRAAQDAAVNRPAAPARGKPAEAKPAAKAKSEEGSEPVENAAAPADVQAQFSSDMLALVAAINSITTPADSSSSTDTTTLADPTLGVTADAAGRAQAVLAALQPANGDARGKTDELPAGSAADARTAALDLAQAGAGAATAATAAGEQAGATEAAPEFLAALQESASSIAGTAPAVPQLALQAAQQASHATATKLTPPVGTPAWDQALGQKVVWMVAGEQQSASLTLNPPDLGPLQVVLSVSNSQATATFTAAQPEVRQALEAALPKLRDMLGEAGIQLGQASVNSGNPQQPGDNSQQAAQARNTHGGGFGATDAGDDAQQRVSRVLPASAGVGLVDTFA